MEQSTTNIRLTRAELDFEVAQLFGWKTDPSVSFYVDPAGCPKEYLPHFSTDLNLAWRLIDHASEHLDDEQMVRFYDLLAENQLWYLETATATSEGICACYLAAATGKEVEFV